MNAISGHQMPSERGKALEHIGPDEGRPSDAIRCNQIQSSISDLMRGGIMNAISGHQMPSERGKALEHIGPDEGRPSDAIRCNQIQSSISDLMRGDHERNQMPSDVIRCNQRSPHHSASTSGDSTRESGDRKPSGRPGPISAPALAPAPLLSAEPAAAASRASSQYSSASSIESKRRATGLGRDACKISCPMRRRSTRPPLSTPPKTRVMPRGVNVRQRLRKHERAAVASRPETIVKSKSKNLVTGGREESA